MTELGLKTANFEPVWSLQLLLGQPGSKIVRACPCTRVHYHCVYVASLGKASVSLDAPEVAAV